MEADRQAQEARVAAKKEEKQAKIQQVTNLEERIIEENSLDVTPHPQRPCPQPRQVWCTETMLEMELSLNADDTVERFNCSSNVDFVQGSNAHDTDVEEAARAMKKVKESKPKVRDAVDKA